MRRAEVLMHGIPAGILEDLETGKKYRFIYFEKYTGPSIALTMPVGGKAQYIDLLNKRFSKLD